jgi:hypothetical protein
MTTGANEVDIATVEIRPPERLSDARMVTVGCSHGTTRVGFDSGGGSRAKTGRDETVRRALGRHRGEHSCRCIGKLWRRYFGAQQSQVKRTMSGTVTGSRPSQRPPMHARGQGEVWMVLGVVLALAVAMLGVPVGLGVGLVYGGVQVLLLWLFERHGHRRLPPPLPAPPMTVYEWQLLERAGRRSFWRQWWAL